MYKQMVKVINVRYAAYHIDGGAEEMQNNVLQYCSEGYELYGPAAVCSVNGSVVVVQTMVKYGEHDG